MIRSISAGLLIALAAFLMLVALQPGPAVAAGCAGQVVTASWYGKETCRKGRICQTANGTRFNGSQWLVAHKSLPFGTKLRLTYKGRSVTVPVLDRGPFVAGRTVDASEAVARKLGMKSAGVVRLCMERLT